MIDFVLQVISSVVDTVFEDWYPHHSWWVKAIVVSTFVFIVLMILYFLVFLPFFSTSRGSS